MIIAYVAGRKPTFQLNKGMALGILFNVDQLGGAYGLAAYRLLFDTADPVHFRGCYFSDGELGEQYCIAIESSDPQNLFKIETAVGASDSAGFAASDARLVFDDRVLSYLAPAGYISHEGMIERVENSWMKSAWNGRPAAATPNCFVAELDSATPPTIIDSTPPASTARLNDEYAPGDVIGSDYVVRDVRKGGMGIVYIVEDLKSRAQNIRLQLALKTFQPRYLWNDEAIARFEREALMWIELGKHQNIVHAMLVQRVANRPYVWLEFIDGKSLADRLARQRLTIAEVLNYSFQFCRGMRHAHEKHGVIHRDIKPANILITQDDVLKIADFGLSKLQAELAGEACAQEVSNISADEVETLTGVFKTPAGQFMGTPAYIAPEGIISPQSVDVRSDIYSFGIVLFEMLAGERPFRGPNILQQHLHAVPPPVRLLNQDVSVDLDQLVTRCLEKDPNQRFQNLAELELALMQVHESASEILLPEGEDVSVPVFGQWFMKGFTFMQLGKYEAAISCFQKVIELNSTQHEAYNNIGVCLSNLGRYEEAVSAIEKAVALKPDYSEAWSNLGDLYGRQQRYDDGIAASNRALEIEPRWAEAYSNLGSNQAGAGHFDEARSSFSRAIAADESYWLAYLKLAQLYADHGSLEQALQLLRTAIEINPREADLLASIAACLFDLNQQQEAAKYLALALQTNSAHPLARRVERLLAGHRC